MSIKFNGIALIVASVILGGSVFSAAMVSKGLILQKERVQPKENILTTTVGHVNLGKVYSERRGMDIYLSQESGKSTPAINLKNVDPNDFSKELHEAFVNLAKDVNDSQGLTGDKAIKPENLSGKVSFKLSVKTYMQYTSEYMPMYTLMINDDDVIIDKDEPFERQVVTEAERSAKNSAPSFIINSFIKEPSSTPMR